ncbi:MAG: hypothetical protein ACP5QG_04875 [candidate division WOR-3 bacterium]
MNTREKISRATILFSAGQNEEFQSYMEKLRNEDSLAFSLTEVWLAVCKAEASRALRVGRRLLPAVSDNPDLAPLLFRWIGMSYRMMGELGAAENYYLRAMEMAERTGDKKSVSEARLNLLYSRFFRSDYELLYGELKEFLRTEENNHSASYLMATMEIIRGRPDRGVNILDRLLESVVGKHFTLSIKEMKGLALRMLGRPKEALETLLDTACGFADLGSAYAVFPCAKALEISRLGGQDPPPSNLVKRCLALSRKGGWGERAAAEEVSALLLEGQGAARGLLSAARGYRKVYQNMEAFMSGVMAALLGWRIDSQVFPEAMKFLGDMIPFYPGFKNDPLVGDFISGMELFLSRERDSGQQKGIRAYLIGEFRVVVDGREIPLWGWRRNKALRAFVYLLLSPNHRIPKDHLFYLLWPRERFNPRTREWLYTALVTVRKNLGRPGLLTRKYDHYQLEEVWTDFKELENLIYRAEATQDQKERAELLDRARDLARQELLPEIIDDQYIDEHRQYYERLRRRVLGDKKPGT